MITIASFVRSAVLPCLLALAMLGCATPHPWLAQDSFVTDEKLETELRAIETSLTENIVAVVENDAQTLARLDALNAEIEALAASVRRIERSVRSLHEVSRVTPAGVVERTVPPVVNAAPMPDEKLVVGRVEWVGLPSIGTYLKARVDTGASLASISARDITIFERDGRRWVRFRLGLTDQDSVVPSVRDTWFEFRVRRFVRIVQATGSERRPVIRLPMTLGPITQQVEFTLNDRTALSHPVLLGRRFMMDMVMVDVSRAFAFPRPEFPGGEPSDKAERDQFDEEELVD